MPTAAVPLKPRAISVNEAAAYVGLSRFSVYKLVREDRLRAIKVGARTLIDVASLDALIAEAPTLGRAA